MTDEFNQKLNEKDRQKLEADLIKDGYTESGARMLSKTATYASDEECEYYENRKKEFGRLKVSPKGKIRIKRTHDHWLAGFMYIRFTDGTNNTVIEVPVSGSGIELSVSDFIDPTRKSLKEFECVLEISCNENMTPIALGRSIYKENQNFEIGIMSFDKNYNLIESAGKSYPYLTDSIRKECKAFPF